MDVTSRAVLDHDDKVERGTLGWSDAAGFRYHIWVHPNPDGVWQLTQQSVGIGTGRRPLGGWVYKNPPDGPRSGRTQYLRADAKANAKAIAYVLEQQNAHHLIEDSARDQLAVRARKEAEDAAARGQRMRDALIKFRDDQVYAPEITVSTVQAVNELLKLSDASMISLSSAILKTGA